MFCHFCNADVSAGINGGARSSNSGGATTITTAAVVAAVVDDGEAIEMTDNAFTDAAFFESRTDHRSISAKSLASRAKGYVKWCLDAADFWVIESGMVNLSCLFICYLQFLSLEIGRAHV